MNSKLKNRLIFLGSFVLLLAAFAFWYKVTYSMKLHQNSDINSAAFPTKILIATQGSTFKDAVVTNIINFYKKDSVFIKTIDVSQLHTLNLTSYNAIVILHTWEYGKPPRSVKQFIYDNINDKNKMIVYATSGAGTNKIEGIDAIVGESIIENASDVSDKIIDKIEILLR